MSLLLVNLILIFYLVQLFFGNITIYLTYVSEKNIIINNFYEIYKSYGLIKFHFLRINYFLNVYLILLIIFGIFLWNFSFFIILYEFYNYFIRVCMKLFKIPRRIFLFYKKIVNLKVFQFLIFPMFYFLIWGIHEYYYPFIQEEGLIMIIVLFLNYFIILINIFFFIKGTCYYKIDNKKQIYFLISILAISSIMVISFILGMKLYAYHFLNAKFLSLFIIFNLIIVQNTYFKDFMKKKKVYLFLFMIILFHLGVYYSLRRIGWE